jgi:hypothetical protein
MADWRAEPAVGPTDPGGEFGLVVVDPSGTDTFDPTSVAGRPEAAVFATTPDRIGVMESLAGADRDPERFGHVDVGNGGVRSAAATDGAGDPFGTGPDRVPGAGLGSGGDGLAADEGPAWYSHVAEPFDLPAVARAVDRHATRLADAADDEDDGRSIDVHVDAITGYLDRLDGPTLFRFLHVVTARVRSLGATGYAYVVADPETDAVRTAEALFDAVYEPDETGDAFAVREPEDVPCRSEFG